MKVNRQDTLDESAQAAFLSRQQPENASQAEETPPSGAATAALTQPQSELEDNAETGPRLPAELCVPSNPLAYRLPGFEPQHHEQAKLAGTWMQAAGLTASEGKFIAQAALAAAAKPMSDAEFKLASRKLSADLEKRWGADKQAHIATVQDEMDRIDQVSGGQLRPFLEQHREITISKYLITTIAHRLQRRKGK